MNELMKQQNLGENKDNNLVNILAEIVMESSKSSNRLATIANALMAIAKKQAMLETKLSEAEKLTEKALARIDNIDCINIEGTPRQRLNAMIRKYSLEKGIMYSHAWKEFKRRFNLAYGTNIELRRDNYCLKHNIKSLTIPEYLERVNLIEDALRVADKMLN